MGILYSICKDVRQNLPDAYVIPIQSARKLMIHLHFQFDLFIFRPLRSHIRQIMNHAADVIFHRDNLHFPRVNLRKIKDVINQ